MSKVLLAGCKFFRDGCWNFSMTIEKQFSGNLLGMELGWICVLCEYCINSEYQHFFHWVIEFNLRCKTCSDTVAMPRIFKKPVCICGWTADSDSGSSSGSESEAEDAQSARAGSKAAHEKVWRECERSKQLCEARKGDELWQHVGGASSWPFPPIVVVSCIAGSFVF
jgi:hypothetical protein